MFKFVFDIESYFELFLYNFMFVGIDRHFQSKKYEGGGGTICQDRSQCNQQPINQSTKYLIQLSTTA